MEREPASACLADDELLELARGGRALGDAPAAEAHLADCASCSAALAALLAAAPTAAAPGEPAAPGWGELAGRTLGPYRLDAQIGAGAMGVVYRAWDERLGRHVAVKLLSARLAGSPETVRRLEIEARAAAAVNHANVVTVFDVGAVDGVHFVVSELVAGETLRSAIDRRAVDRERAVDLARQLARGLAAAHAQGVVHRDLKPQNVMITDEGVVKILDFGLAKLAGDDRRRALDATEPGAVLGTVGYLAPEQARGEAADARSDLFALGAIFYEMLSGRRAFGGATFAERLSAVLRDTPPGLDEATLGPFAPVVARCLEKDPRRRFQSAQDLAWWLDAPLAPPSPPRAPPSPPPARRAGVSRRTLLLAVAGAGAAGVALGRWALAPRRRVAAFVDPGDYLQLSHRHGRVSAARFTPDGDSVVYAAAWDEDPLAVFAARLRGGGTRRLALPPADLLALSRRGELALGLERRFVAGFHESGRLAVVPLEGGEPRLLADAVQDADYGPDGELAVVRRGGKGFVVELPLGTPVLDVEAWPSHVRVAPDGRRLACILHPAVDDDRGDVVVVERAGGAWRTLATGYSSVSGLAWAPDGRRLWVSAARSGSNAALRIVDLTGGETVVARTTGRLRLHDVAADGRVAVTHDTRRMRLMVRPPGGGAELDLSLSDVSLVTGLSGDGRAMISGEFGEDESMSGAYLRSLPGGVPLHLGPGLPHALSADGRRVIAQLFGVTDRLAVYATTSGAAASVPLGPVVDLRWARWRGASDDVVLGGAAEGRAARLWRARVGGGAPEPFTDEGVAGVGHVSVDGAQVAFVGGDGQLLLVPIADPGAARRVPGTFAGREVMAWTPDASEVYLRSLEPPYRIERVDLASGAARPHAEITPPRVGARGLDAMVISAAGDTVAYSYGQELSRLYVLPVSARP